jgi:LysM repeat protein
MQTITAQDGDTWESIAEARSIPLSSLLAANGLDPNACTTGPVPGTDIALPNPPPAVAVAPGEDHSLDSPSEACLWVRLDMSPAEAASTQDSVRLYDDEQTHDVTLSVADHFTANGACVDVLFDSVDPSLSYSVDYLTDEDRTITVVASTPFDELRDDALPDPEPDAPAPDSGDVDDGYGDRSVPPIHAGDLSPDALASVFAPRSGSST